MGARILQRTLAVVEVGGKFTAAREMDTDAAPTELEDEIDYDGSEDRDEDGLVAASAKSRPDPIANCCGGNLTGYGVHS